MGGAWNTPAEESTVDPSAVEEVFPEESEEVIHDVTEAAKEKAGTKHGPHILNAEWSELDDFLTVETSIIDPRGENGSVEAKTALAICESLKELPRPVEGDYPKRYPQVKIMEADGTHFVLYGHPSYGNACVEI